MRKSLSITVVILILFELVPASVYASQNKLRVGFLGVFMENKEEPSLSSMVSPMFSDSKFFVWEKITKDTPTSIFWGVARIDAKFQHNSNSVSGRFTLYIREPSTNVDLFVLDATGVSSTFSGMVVDWSPFEKEALLNGLSVLSRRLEDLWRSNSIVIYSEGKVFECDMGELVGIVEGSHLSVFRDDRLIAKGKVTSLDQKKCRAEIIYSSGDKSPIMGDLVKIAYIPPAPEVSFVNQANSVLSAIAGVALLAGIVTLYNIARANAAPKITLIAPTDGIEFKTGQKVNFSWLSNQDFQRYKIEIMDATGNVIDENDDSGTSYQASFSSIGEYSWKVTGYTSNGTSVESETRTFYIVY